MIDTGYISRALTSLRGLGIKAWAPFAFQTDGRIWDVNGRIILPSTEVVSGNGTLFNRNRIINAAIVNRLRISRSFSKLGQVGALLEEGRTNLELRSEQIDNAYYGKTGVTIAADDRVAPDDTVTADALKETTANSTHDIRVAAGGDIAVTSGQSYAKSSFNRDIARGEMRHGFGSSNFPGGTFAFYDLSPVGTGTLGSGGDDSGIDSLADSYVRAWLTSTAASTGTTTRPVMHITKPSEVITYVGDTAKGLHHWGGQFEAGDFPSSYIPTVASTVTRAADDLRYSNASEALLTSPEGSVICIVTPDLDNGGLSANAMIFDGVISGSAEGVRLRIDTSGKFNLLVRHLGSSVADITSTIVVERGRTYVVAASWKDGEYRLYVDGVLEASDNLGDSATSTNTTLYIGQSMSNDQWLFSTLAHLLTFDRVLALRQFQSVAKDVLQPIYPGRLRLAA